MCAGTDNMRIVVSIHPALRIHNVLPYPLQVPLPIPLPASYTISGTIVLQLRYYLWAERY
eukprot:3220115-Rhodomonas_salina.2